VPVHHRSGLGNRAVISSPKRAARLKRSACARIVLAANVRSSVSAIASATWRGSVRDERAGFHRSDGFGPCAAGRATTLPRPRRASASLSRSSSPGTASAPRRPVQVANLLFIAGPGPHAAARRGRRPRSSRGRSGPVAATVLGTPASGQPSMAMSMRFCMDQRRDHERRIAAVRRSRDKKFSTTGG